MTLHQRIAIRMTEDRIPMNMGSMGTLTSTWRILVSAASDIFAFLFTEGASTLTGKYSERDLPDYSSRNFQERGFTVGIGGLVWFHTLVPSGLYAGD